MEKSGVEVGAWGGRKVRLLDNELFVKQGYVNWRRHSLNWPSGPIFLTDARLIWTPDPVSLASGPWFEQLEDIRDVVEYRNRRFDWWLGYRSAWLVRTDAADYLFSCFSLGTNARAGEWVPLVRQWAQIPS